MLEGLPKLVAVGEVTVLTAEDTKVGQVKLVLQPPCVTPADSEFGGGIDLSKQTGEGVAPKSCSVWSKRICVDF